MSEGLCYGCRHIEDASFSTTGHCYGTGDLEPTTGLWDGFHCVCPCRLVSADTDSARVGEVSDA